MRLGDPALIGPVLHRAALASGFSGVARVDLGDDILFARAYGWADRAREVPARTWHRFAVASIAKCLTALTVGTLVDDGRLTLDAPVRPVLGDDLPLVDDRVTVGQLLAHTSGIGDYLDESGEDEATDYVLPVPVHLLDSTEAYLTVLDGRPQVSEPGARFAYCNSGFVIAALVSERVGGRPFADLVTERVLGPAGMTRTGYPRTDEVAGDVALGYLGPDGLRTNVLHLPVRGSGDGGAVTTAADLSALWRAVHAHRVVSAGTLAALLEPVSEVPDERARYGRGFWLAEDGPVVYLEGADAGVSGRSAHDPTTGLTVTVLANTSDGAWPVLRALLAEE